MRDNFDNKKLIGLKIDEARELAGWGGKSIRVIKEDSILCGITDDIIFDRIDVEVKDGVIIKS